MAPVRQVLKPGEAFPPNAEQLAAIEAVKELLLEDNLLAFRDEAAALTAANAWLADEPPTGRPYGMGADMSGYAIGAGTGQCGQDNVKLPVLLYFSAHLSQYQQKWHPFEEEFGGLLCARRDCVKHLGRIPAILHTDPANITHLDALPLYCIAWSLM